MATKCECGTRSSIAFGSSQDLSPIAMGTHCKVFIATKQIKKGIYLESVCSKQHQRLLSTLHTTTGWAFRGGQGECQFHRLGTRDEESCAPGGFNMFGQVVHESYQLGSHPHVATFMISLVRGKPEDIISLNV